MLGRPLHVPRVEDPSKALCQEHLDRFIAEMQRVVAAHQSRLGFADMTLEVH